MTSICPTLILLLLDQHLAAWYALPGDVPCEQPIEGDKGWFPCHTDRILVQGLDDLRSRLSDRFGVNHRLELLYDEVSRTMLTAALPKLTQWLKDQAWQIQRWESLASRCVPKHIEKQRPSHEWIAQQIWPLLLTDSDGTHQDVQEAMQHEIVSLIEDTTQEIEHMPNYVCNQAGESVLLSSTPFAKGGEAEVYAVPQYPRAVVKIYHDQILEKRSEALRVKIEAMRIDSNFSDFQNSDRLAWPLFSVFDENHQWRGYAMRKAAGVRMNVLAHAMAYREHFPALDRPALVGYLLDLLSTIKKLHAAGVLLGDYNLANFLCDPKSSSISLIDCDSWQIHANGKSFFCPVAAPDMLAPELHGEQLDKIGRTLESEHFSLAILLFKVLMLGRHPYDVVGGEGPVDNIKKGYFPYGKGGGGIPEGVWFNIWSHLPFRLKEQFVRTFKDGAKNSSERTSTAEWIDVLHIYRRELEKGYHDTQLKPAKPKSQAYRGTATTSKPIII